MCLAVYVAVEGSIPGIDERQFNVRPLARREERVRRQFSKTNVYYVGSHTGCGCGFIGDDPDPEDVAARAQSVRAFVAYLDAQLPVDDLELFTCWEGAQAKAPQRRLELRRSQLAERTDWSDELCFAVVTRT